jgi:diguanylate cyclase (GGDEF)-like protein
MAGKGFFRSLTDRGQSASPKAGAELPGNVIRPDDAKARLGILEDFERAGFGWLWASDADGCLIYISESAAQSTGKQPADILGKHLTELFETDPDNPDERSDRPFKFQLSARSRIVDLVVRFALGKSKHEAKQTWWSFSAQPNLDGSGSFKGYRGIAKDITVEYERKLMDSRLAEYDSLTGLANRHRMSKRLDQLVTAHVSTQRSLAVMMLDLDRFKHVNDTLGHQAGDALLKQVADRLHHVVLDCGEIGRLGGDEFQIILPDNDDRGSLGELAEKIIQVLSQPFPIDGERAVIGASVGIAIAPYDGINREDLVHSADLALYASKNNGRGQFCFYTAGLKDRAEERRILMEDLREALANDALELHYQPVVRLEDNMVIAFEALMRWDHPERGPVSPRLFIPIAEESNLIIQLGEWALKRACREAAAMPKSVTVAVNVSALQFNDPQFPEAVANAITLSGLEAERLELELTESVFMGDSEQVDQTFKALKDLGVRLALDDFGTGYSSLSYLRSAPFDKIKVDKSFVDTCTQKDLNSAKIIAAIMGLANALGMDVVVEGVEAFDQLEVVKGMGAKYVQGWIFSKALAIEVVRDRMSTGEFRIEPDGPDHYRSDRRTVFRRIGIIHEDHRYAGVLRDLSRTGARVEGLLGVPVGTQLVLDLGGGQLAVCAVSRAKEAMMGVEFETPLVNDGAGGLCTRHRVSPYALAAAGMPLEALPAGNYPMQLIKKDGDNQRKPLFVEVKTPGI